MAASRSARVTIGSVLRHNHIVAAMPISAAITVPSPAPTSSGRSFPRRGLSEESLRVFRWHNERAGSRG